MTTISIIAGNTNTNTNTNRQTVMMTMIMPQHNIIIALQFYHKIPTTYIVPNKKTPRRTHF